MQVITVAVIGTAVGLAVKAVDEGRVDRRRAEDRALDERKRVDEFLTGVMDRTITAYNSVKSSRRLLEAENKRADGEFVTVDSYDTHLTNINTQQLDFESLGRVAPICEERLRTIEQATGRGAYEPAPATVSDLLRRVEDYLNVLVDEYQRNRYKVAKAGEADLPIGDLKELGAFVGPSITIRAAGGGP